MKRQAPKTATGERALLAQLRTRLAHGRYPALALGIGDDCALLKTRPGEELAVTTDFSIEDRHFRLDWHQPELVGHRALARGLSDLAAMGARPVAAFLSLALPRPLTLPHWRRGKLSWMERFYNGLLTLADAHHVPLAGGDLSEAPLAVADIILIGALPRGSAIKRSTAKAGDRICVTGSLGGGVAALNALRQLSAMHPQRIPRLNDELAAPLAISPRIKQGTWLRTHKAATAMMDLSDGLSIDLTRLCEESGLCAELDAELLPAHPLATREQALHGGDDYELLFTIPADAKLPRQIAGIPLTVIGRMLPRRKARPTISLLTAEGAQPLKPQGWEHFA